MRRALFHESNSVSQRIAAPFLEVYPFQPATALWRATEIAVLVKSGLPQGRGLDVGCGDGHLTGIVLEHLEHGGAREVVGFDPDPAEIELARATGLYRELICCGGDKVPLPDGSFDWALSNSVLEHIPDVRPVLAETARLLRAGGEFVFTVPAPDFHRLLRGPIAGKRDRAAYLAELDRRLAHFYYWDVAQWTRELGAVGLEVTQTKPYLNRPQTRRWEAISRVTAGALMLLTGRKKRPIEVQRSLGMRREGLRMPAPLARKVGAALGHGMDVNALETRAGSCLLVRAVKRG